MEKKREEMGEEVGRLHDLVGRLERGVEEEEAVDLLESALDEAERCSKNLEEERE